MPLIMQEAPQTDVLRRDEMRTPDEGSAMVSLEGLGWGAERIAAELGCSKNTVERYLSLGGWRPRAWRSSTGLRRGSFRHPVSEI